MTETNQSNPTRYPQHEVTTTDTPPDSKPFDTAALIAYLRDATRDPPCLYPYTAAADALDARDRKIELLERFRENDRACLKPLQEEIGKLRAEVKRLNGIEKAADELIETQRGVTADLRVKLAVAERSYGLAMAAQSGAIKRAKKTERERDDAVLSMREISDARDQLVKERDDLQRQLDKARAELEVERTLTAKIVEYRLEDGRRMADLQPTSTRCRSKRISGCGKLCEWRTMSTSRNLDARSAQCGPPSQAKGETIAENLTSRDPLGLCASLEQQLRDHLDTCFSRVRVWDADWVRTEIVKNADDTYEVRVIGKLTPRNTTAAHLIESLPYFIRTDPPPRGDL